MRLATRGALLAAGMLCSAPAAEATPYGSIGVYADALGSLTRATFSIGVPRTLFVLAKTDGPVTGAEFRIDGFPEDWYVRATANPAAEVWLGDPIHVVGGVHRANIAFRECTPTRNGVLLLCSIIVIPKSPVAPRAVTVAVADPPTNPSTTTPIFTLCDYPNYSQVEAAGDTFGLETRAPRDLDYSALPGYDFVRGVVPEAGVAGEVSHFRVVYTSADGQLPAAGSPRLELDADGDGDTSGPAEGSFTVSPADVDSTLVNGKEYRFDVALRAPPSGSYRYRFTARTAGGDSVPGAATAWRSLPFASDRPDLAVNAEEIRILPPNPDPTTLATIIAKIENLSDAPAANVAVRVEDVFGNLIAERTLASVGARSATEFACTWNFADRGFQPVVVRVDPGGTVAQRRTSNDAATHGVFVHSDGTQIGFTIRGLPPLITVPPAALFGFDGSARYTLGNLPEQMVRGAPVTVVPSWGAPQHSRTSAAGEFSAGFVAPSAPGTYRLTVHVTDGARSDSAMAEVRVETLPGHEPPHPADLVMQLGAELGAGGTEAVLSWAVVNHGDRTSLPTTARLLADDLTPLADVVVGALDPGATQALATLHVPLSVAGLRAFTAHADPENTLQELRKDDNVAIATLSVPSDCVDLAFDALRFASAPLCAGSTAHTTVRVSNRGRVTSAASRVACRIDGTEVGSVPLAALQRGASAELAFELSLALGCSDIRLVLDPEGAPGADCDATSNALSSAACLGDCGPPPPVQYPDFRVLDCDIAASTSHPSPGAPVVFHAWISNSGLGNATAAVQVRFEIDSNIIGSAVAVGPILSGGRVGVTAPSAWSADFAPHVLRVVIDPGGQERPEDVGNNSATRALPWNLRILPLGRCAPASPAMFSSCGPCPFDSISIRARVTNTGLFDCASVRVEFRDETQDVVLGAVDLSGLPGGGSCAPLPVPVAIATAFSAAGLHHIAAIADPQDAWHESDETDNRDAQDLQVGCAMVPDLTASAHLPAGPTPQPGDTLRAVEIVVRNVGTGPAFGVEARLRVDGLGICNMDMGAVAAHSEKTVLCTTPWVVKGLGCDQLLEVCADPANQIAESNEDNNCSVSGVTGTGETDLELRAAAISITPPNPSLGDPVEIKVGMYNARGVESNCVLTVKFGVGGLLSTLGSVPLQFPAGETFFPNAATFVWTVPMAPPLDLKFELTDICPTDIVPSNNVVYGSLPWFRVPETPVTVSDLAAESTPDGVRVHWRASEAARFALERRGAGDLEWKRLANDIAPAASSRQRYEYLDRDAEAGAQLEYRLVCRLEDGREQVLGVLSVRHDAARTVVMQFRPVRPQPFRPGGVFEFVLPAPRPVELALFDTAGRRVASLQHGHASAGLHAVPWDGRDGSGRRVPAGVYFCRFAAGSFQQTRRIVLLP